MAPKDFLKVLSVLLLVSILFSPTDSGAWKYSLALGLGIGTAWFVKK